MCGKLQEKMPHTPANTSIEQPAPTVTVRTPQCGHTVEFLAELKLLQVSDPMNLVVKSYDLEIQFTACSKPQGFHIFLLNQPLHLAEFDQNSPDF